MTGEITRLAILGGGTAGWLTACLLAARHKWLDITLVEAPDVATIGVGEGTWPTMRQTLQAIGICEEEFLRECDASFKQGSRFDGWVSGGEGDSYLHPFTPPPAAPMAQLLAGWQQDSQARSFAGAMTAQAELCARDLAPRQRAMPDYAGAVNYAYHLDAGKFAALLARHATGRLGVRHLRAHVSAVRRSTSGDIAALKTREGEEVAADLFVDCSGQAAVLIGRELEVEWIDRGDVSFNDRALAVQVPVEDGSPIASQTIATAHRAGWIWDIALPARRGIGCVYSSRFMDEGAAREVLDGYIRARLPAAAAAAIEPRLLRFATGYRARFWHRNCVAIGLAAGFIEPLEASAIVLIELSARALAENFPASRRAMDIHARRFNALFRYRWERIVDFLKLHYVLSRREEPYWQAQRDPETVPRRLAEQLELWRDQPPSPWDFPQIDEIFSAASQQYVLYGMGFAPPRGPVMEDAGAEALARLADVRQQARALCAALPANRTYFDMLAKAAERPQTTGADA